MSPWGGCNGEKASGRSDELDRKQEGKGEVLGETWAAGEIAGRNRNPVTFGIISK